MSEPCSMNNIVALVPAAFLSATSIVVFSIHCRDISMIHGAVAAPAVSWS